MRFLLFIIAVIAIGAGTIKLKQKNRQVIKNTLKEVWDSIPEEAPPVSTPPAKTEPEVPAPAPAWPKEVAHEDIVIPENLPFRKMIVDLLYMSEKYPEEMPVDFYAPINTATIAMFEERIGIRLPEDLKSLYLLANGLNIERSTLTFYPLEVIEHIYQMGYCDFVKEGDAGDYLLIGDMIGDGEDLILHKESGHIFRYDHGDLTDFECVENLIAWAIEFVYDGWIGKGTDERLDKYLSES